MNTTYKLKQLIINKDGCPCGTHGQCCNQPDLYTPDHECSDESVCEDCYVTACRTCGNSCSCDL